MAVGPGFVGARISKDNIGGVDTWIRDRVAQALEQGAHLILQAAQDNVQVRTGELKASGVVVQIGRLTFIVRFGDGLDDARAIYVEYGTSKAPAYPYLVPATDDLAATICQLVAEACNGRVKHTDVRVAQLSTVSGGYTTNDVSRAGA